MKLVFFGANDACLADSPTGQHVPLAKYAENLRAIIKDPSVTAQSPRLILVTPTPVDEYQLDATESLKGYARPSRTAEHTRKYAVKCKEVGDELGLTVLDLWSIFVCLMVSAAQLYIHCNFALYVLERLLTTDSFRWQRQVYVPTFSLIEPFDMFCPQFVLHDCSGSYPL